MLAQNFKTPADLSLTEIEFSALVTVLGMLERGELIYGSYPLAVMDRAPNEFNMAAVVHESSTCGTIGCLCGWAHIVSGHVAFAEYLNRSEEGDFSGLMDMPLRLQELFGVGSQASRLWSITPAQAATALRNYLTHGASMWGEVISAA